MTVHHRGSIMELQGGMVPVQENYRTYIISDSLGGQLDHLIIP